MSIDRNLRIAYSTNVHPGESLAEIRRSLDAWTVPVSRRAFGAGPAGLELRIGIGAARELVRERASEELQAFLEERQLVLFSINAFPLLDFHARRVKGNVYRPSWAEASRARWTSAIARILAKLLPPGIEGTVSTLAGGFRPAGNDPRTLGKMAAQYVRTVGDLARIEAETGRTVLLAVEPEPETTMETARDVVRFVEDHLVPAARDAWRKHGLSRSGAEERLLRLFTVNFDACHFSVLFEDLAESVRTLEAAGLRIGKVHVTSALSLRNPHRAPGAYRRFRGLDEPRYFHQFAGRDREGRVVWRGRDLDQLPRRLPSDLHPEVVELRSHYHVPLHRKEWSGLATTRDETRRLVLDVVRKRLSSQLVVETYTWPIFEESRPKLVDGIVRELRWLLGAVEEARGR